MTRPRPLAWRVGILLQLFRTPYQASPDETGRERKFGFWPRSLAAPWPGGLRAFDDLIGREPAVAKLASRAAADG